MRRLASILAVLAVAACAYGGPRISTSHSISVGTSTTALHTVTLPCDGYLEEIRILPSAGATGNVAFVVDHKDSSFADRTLITSNSVAAAAYWRPRTDLNERYVVKGSDVFKATVTNGTMRPNTSWRFVVIWNDER